MRWCKRELDVEIREVKLADKVPEFIELSPKATVPVLQTPEGEVIEESFDIMFWALSQSDPDGWLKKFDSRT